MRGELGCVGWRLTSKAKDLLLVLIRSLLPALSMRTGHSGTVTCEPTPLYPSNCPPYQIQPNSHVPAHFVFLFVPSSGVGCTTLPLPEIHASAFFFLSFFLSAVYFRPAGSDAIADLSPCHSFQNHHGLIRYWDMTRDGDEAKYGAVFDEAGMLARFGLVQRESED